MWRYASQPIQPPCSDIESDLNINLKYTGYYFLSKKKEKIKSRKKEEKIASYGYATDFTVYTYYLMYSCAD